MQEFLCFQLAVRLILKIEWNAVKKSGEHFAGSLNKLYVKRFIIKQLTKKTGNRSCFDD